MGKNGPFTGTGEMGGDGMLGRFGFEGLFFSLDSFGFGRSNLIDVLTQAKSKHVILLSFNL